MRLKVWHLIVVFWYAFTALPVYREVFVNHLSTKEPGFFLGMGMISWGFAMVVLALSLIIFIVLVSDETIFDTDECTNWGERRT